MLYLVDNTNPECLSLPGLIFSVHTTIKGAQGSRKEARWRVLEVGTLPLIFLSEGAPIGGPPRAVLSTGSSIFFVHRRTDEGTSAVAAFASPHEAHAWASRQEADDSRGLVFTVDAFTVGE